MAEIQSINRESSADEAMAILDRDGAVIYERVLDHETMETIGDELDSYLDQTGRRPGGKIEGLCRTGRAQPGDPRGHGPAAGAAL